MTVGEGRRMIAVLVHVQTTETIGESLGYSSERVRKSIGWLAGTMTRNILESSKSVRNSMARGDPLPGEPLTEPQATGKNVLTA